MRNDAEIRIGSGIAQAYEPGPDSDRCATLSGNPMKHRFGSLAAALGCVTLLVVACGGSDFEGPSGSSGATTGGASSAGAAGKSAGGSASGGSASGGTASGGAITGGTASGGAITGGTASGGAITGGTASGGATTGGTASGGASGDPLKCEADTDCVACAYPTAPQKEADCYCASCAGTPLSKTACTSNHEAWTKTCGATPRPCPAIACVMPPIPKCKSKMCVAG
jgi:hypothetical protein